MNGLFSVDCRRQLWWQKRRERKRITYHRRMRRVAGRVEAGEGSITCCLQLLTGYHLHLAPLPHPVLLHQLGGRQEVVVLEVIVDGPKHLVQEGLHGAVEVPGHTRQRVVLGTIPTNYAIQCYNTSVGHLVRVDLLTEDDITGHHLPGERHRVLDVHIVVASAVDHLNTQSELSIHNIHQSQRSILASPSRSCPSRPRRC